MLISANLENPAVVSTGLEKVYPYSSSQEGSAVLKNVQTTGQLHSSPMLVSLCSISCRLGFSIKWTKTYRCPRWVSKRQRKQRSNCQHLLDHRKSKENPEKTSTFVSLTMLKPLTVDNNKLWKTLKEMGIPDHLTCLLRNLYAGQEATVRTLYGTTDWFRIEKGVWQICLLSPCLFNLYTEHMMRNARLDEL